MDDPVLAKDKRDVWDIERLTRWFTHPVYDRPAAAWDHKCWLPLLGAFTGARLEELAKLRVVDVIRDHDTLCIGIKWGEGAERLKSKSAVRLVPIHSELIACGFALYVERIRRADHEWLWPTLAASAKLKRGPNFTKWFGGARVKIKVYDRRINFQSFRHNVETALLNESVPVVQIDDLLGHKRSKDTGRTVYFKEYKLEVLRRAIEQLRYDGLDLSRFHAAA